MSSSFWIESQEDTCGSQPSSVTSRPHCLPSAQCNEFSLNIKLQLWQWSKSSWGSHICCYLKFPEEFLTVVSRAFPVDHAHGSGAQCVCRGFSRAIATQLPVLMLATLQSKVCSSSLLKEDGKSSQWFIPIFLAFSVSKLTQHRQVDGRSPSSEQMFISGALCDLAVEKEIMRGELKTR